MPLVESYESHIDSDIADMKNIGKAPWRDRLPPRSCCAASRTDDPGRIWTLRDRRGPGEARGYLTKGRDRFFRSYVVEVPSRRWRRPNTLRESGAGPGRFARAPPAQPRLTTRRRRRLVDQHRAEELSS